MSDDRPPPPRRDERFRPISSTMAPTTDFAASTLERRADPARIAFFQVIDEVLLEWWVVEVDARHVPGTRGAHCLLFSSASCIRRVWHYPANWRSLDDAALVALSWAR